MIPFGILSFSALIGHKMWLTQCAWGKNGFIFYAFNKPP